MRVFAAAVAAFLALPAQAMVPDLQYQDYSDGDSEDEGLSFQGDFTRERDNLYPDYGSFFTSSEIGRPDGHRFNMYGADMRDASFISEIRADGTMERAPPQFTFFGCRAGMRVASPTQFLGEFTSTARHILRHLGKSKMSNKGVSM